MKTLNIIAALFFSFTALTASAQKKTTEKIPVSGNCGMCKKKIETAAKEAGANAADWDADKKTLTVTYISTSTNAAKIQEAVAATGYDTRDVKATDETYNKLHGCCKYDRVDLGGKKDKAPKADKTDGVNKTEKACCNKEGKETKEGKKESCCSDGGHK